MLSNPEGIRNLNEACSYYLESLENYYSNSNHVIGIWRGSPEIGLDYGEEITKAKFEKILMGIDPRTELQLKRKPGDNQNPRLGYDLTFNAPKSVSLLWVVASEETRKKIEKCQAIAVEKAICHLEKYAAFTRRGFEGKIREKISRLIVGTFAHHQSRENDPHIHTHCVVANLAKRNDGTWGGINAQYFFYEKMAAGAVYRAELAKQLFRELGLKIEKVRKEFELKGMPKSAIDEFSKRRDQIKEAVKECGYDSQKAHEIAALDTRKPKDTRPISEIEMEWKSKLKEFGIEEKNFIGRHSGEIVIDFGEALDAFKELLKYKSVVPANEIRAAIAQSAQGKCGRDGIEVALKNLESHSEVIRMKCLDNEIPYFTSKEMLDLEWGIVEMATKTAKDKRHVIPSAMVTPHLSRNKTLRDEQSSAIKKLTEENGQVKALLGGAGSGKSFLLKVAADIWEDYQKELFFVAPTGTAAKELQKSTGRYAETIDRFKYKNAKKLNSNSIIIVDEAGMLGSRKCHWLIKTALQAGAKIVLVGDPNQLQPIEAGASLRMIVEHIDAAKLREMNRQLVGWQKEATQLFVEKKAGDALELYEKHDRLDVHSSPDLTRQKLTDEFIADITDNPNMSSFILAETNLQVSLLNERIREKMRDTNKLTGPDFTLKVRPKSDSLELIEKKFAVGDHIYFLRNNVKKMGVTNGTKGKILNIKPHKRSYLITAQTESGPTTFCTSEYKEFIHGYAGTIYKSQAGTVDKTYYYLSERTSKEAAYVVMSRHRHDAKIYIDRKSLNLRFNWEECNLSNSHVFPCHRFSFRLLSA